MQPWWARGFFQTHFLKSCIIRFQITNSFSVVFHLLMTCHVVLRCCRESSVCTILSTSFLSLNVWSLQACSLLPLTSVFIYTPSSVLDVLVWSPTSTINIAVYYAQCFQDSRHWSDSHVCHWYERNVQPSWNKELIECEAVLHRSVDWGACVFVCQVKISAWVCWVYCGLCSYYATFTLITLLFHFVKFMVPWQEVTLFSLVTVPFYLFFFYILLRKCKYSYLVERHHRQCVYLMMSMWH